MTCDLCDKPASVHVCEIHDGKKIERQLCSQHAEAAQLPHTESMAPGELIVNGVVCSTPQEAAAMAIFDNLRGTRNFLRKYGRMPSSARDLKRGMSLPDDGPVAEIKDARRLRELRRLDGMVRFICAHSWLAVTKEELKSDGYG